MSGVNIFSLEILRGGEGGNAFSPEMLRKICDFSRGASASYKMPETFSQIS